MEKEKNVLFSAVANPLFFITSSLMMTNYFAKIRQLLQTADLRIGSLPSGLGSEPFFHKFKRMVLIKSNLSGFYLTWL